MFRRATKESFPLACAIATISIWLGCLSCAAKVQQQEPPTVSNTQTSQSNQNQDKPANVPVADPCTQFAELCITEPQNGVEVEARPFVYGKVADANSTVWVIVHQTGTSDFWVQNPVTVTEDDKGAGSWNVQVYIGDSGTERGTRFEIMAIADPKGSKGNQITVGKQTVASWPKAKWKSNVVMVTRR
jgi:hypothetical protein